MPKRLCSHCGQLIDKLNWQRHRDLERGTRRQRGIGPAHERFARFLKTLPPENVWCALCGVRGDTPGVTITVGHIRPRASFSDPLAADHEANLQPECQSCNLSKGSS